MRRWRSVVGLGALRIAYIGIRHRWLGTDSRAHIKNETQKMALGDRGHPRTGEGELQMQPVETPHDRNIGVRHRARQVVETATADAQNLRLLGDRQIVLTVDHRFALSNPALVSAPSKKSFSSVSSPILAWSDFTSTAAGAAPLPPPRPNTSAAPPSSCAFHDVI